jgi:hypothetical protein
MRLEETIWGTRSLNIKALSIMTLGLMILGLVPLNLTTLSVMKIIIPTLGIMVVTTTHIIATLKIESYRLSA